MALISLWWSMSLAVAGEIAVDARIPVLVALDGQTQGEIYSPSILVFEAAAGKRRVTLAIGGRYESVEVDVPESGRATVLVGRTGITVGDAVSPETATGPTEVDLRATGDLIVQVDDRRYRLAEGDHLALTLAPGSHRVAVRDSSGTVIWARGDLSTSGGSAVVQLTEGRLPEISGTGAKFHPDGH